MTKKWGYELQLISIPAPNVVDLIRNEITAESLSYDIYLAYNTGCGHRLSGFFVTQKNCLDHPVAHCPIHADFEVASPLWCLELRRQLNVAVHISSDTTPVQKANVIWLDQTENTPREMPSWLYSLACIPLTFKWDGKLLYSRPFSPQLFESMAKQPQVPQWLKQKLGELPGGVSHAAELSNNSNGDS